MHLAIDHLVGLAEDVAPLAVAADHELDVELGEERRRHLTGEGALLLEVAVLGTEQDLEVVGLDDRLHAADVGEWRVHAHVDLLVGLLRQRVVQLLHGLDRLEVVEVHLPVARDERLA